MDDYRVVKGEEGERYVGEILKNVLLRMDYEYRLVQNTYLPFKSVYGEFGYISAEFDFTVFTPFYIYIIEVKNESYSNCDYSAPLWELNDKDKTTVSNAINQNHTHKEVFCSEMNIPLEKVITIEILLDNDDVIKEKTSFPNDFVFGKEELEDNLFYLLSSENCIRLDCQKNYDSFIKLVEDKGITKEEHIAILKRTEKIETRIRNVIKKKKRIEYIPFKRTDIVKCNCCGVGNLRFKDKLYKSTEKNKKDSRHYFLGCSSYGNSNISCNRGLVYVDDNKEIYEFLTLKPIHIENRNNWGDERVNKTVLDEMNEIKKRSDKLIKENEECNNRIKELSISLKSIQNDKNAAEARIIELKSENTYLKADNKTKAEEISCFKKIFGRFYIRSK